MKDDFKTNKLTTALFLVYLIAIFWIIVFKFNISFSYIENDRSVNLIPYLEPFILNKPMNYWEIILNIFIFLPLGIYAGVLFKKWRFGEKLLLFFSISFLCEISQFIFGIGAFDITDLINNTLGGLIGLFIFQVVEKTFNNSDKARKFINIIATIGTILIILFLLLIKIKHLWIFRM